MIRALFSGMFFNFVCEQHLETIDVQGAYKGFII